MKKPKEVIEWDKWKFEKFTFGKGFSLLLSINWTTDNSSFFRFGIFSIGLLLFRVTYQRAGICTDDGYCDIGCPGCKRCS